LSHLPYVAPFGAFVAFLALRGVLGLPALAENALWIAVTGAAIALFSRRVLDFRVRHWAGTAGLGAVVFLMWIAPDLLFPGYRNYWLFSSPWTGEVAAGLPETDRSNALVLALRALRAAAVAPVAEELFWRGWLMRWLIRPDFATVPLGAYAAPSFWITALLFAAEHGRYWDVGLAAGVAYNWWMIRTCSLGDLMLAHAVTNACLSAYVMAAGRWEYW
jgi:CAAX prenyl protease-like protein